MPTVAPEAVHGFPALPFASPILAAALLESLAAIAVECDLMHRSTLHNVLTKHVHAIEDSVRDMLVEITGLCAAA